MNKYRIIVSEPWDYKNPKGEKNLITGEIQKIISPHCILFKSDYELSLMGISGTLLVLFPRNTATFGNMKNVTVNGGIHLNDFPVTESESTLESNSKFVLIGTLEKITPVLSEP